MSNSTTVRIVSCAILSMACISAHAGFVRPETTRRYLHPPLSENVSVFLREGKITFGDVIHRDDWRSVSYYAGKQPAHGIWLVHGSGDEAYDFKRAVLSKDPDGVPVHSQTWREGDLEVSLAACSPFGRKSTVHGRLVLTNRGKKAVSEKFGFMLRSGPENKMIFMAPDIYRIYAPAVSGWLALPSTFADAGRGVFTADGRFVSFTEALAWDAKTGTARFTVELAPGASREIGFSLGKGAAVKPDFANAATDARKDWMALLARARNRTPFVRSQIVQILQCFCHPTEGDFVLPRQGGLQRFVWPGETVHVAEALDRLGYGDYTRMAVDFLMRFAKPEGNIGPFGNGWAGDTAYSIATFARHCILTDDADCWRRHRDVAMRGFEWIKATRASTASGGEGIVAGLFPPLKSTDSKKRFQHWGMTDLVNETALKTLWEAAEKFGDARSGDVKAEWRAYRDVIEKVLGRWREFSAGKDTFFIPLAPDGKNEEQFLADNFFYLHPGAFAEGGYLTEDEMLRLRKWLIRKGIADEGGLYQRHPATTVPELGRNVWYTTWSEYQWSLGWRRVGRTDLSRQALDALLAWSVTDEDYVGERIHQLSPWFFPWSPNASGSARILKMLLNENMADARK